MKIKNIKVIIIFILLIFIVVIKKEDIFQFFRSRVINKTVSKTLVFFKNYEYKVFTEEKIEGYRVYDKTFYISESISDRHFISLSEDKVDIILDNKNQYVIKVYREQVKQDYYHLYRIKKNGDKIYIDYYKPEITINRISNVEYNMKITSDELYGYYNVFNMYVDYQDFSGDMKSTYIIYPVTLNSDTKIDLSYNSDIKKILHLEFISFFQHGY